MKNFKDILCVVSLRDADRPMLERAVSLAENNQARLTVVTVVAPAASVEASKQWSLSAAVQTLKSFTQPWQQRLHIQHEILVGTGFLEIVRSVLRDGYDLLIKTAENPDVMERLFGSDDMHLLRKCPCPVWLTRADEKSNYSCILTAIDFDLERPDSEDDKLNQQIFDLSSSLAVSDFAELHLVHAWDTPGELTVRTWSDNPDEAAALYIEGERMRHQKGLDLLRDQFRRQIGADAYDHLSPQFHFERGHAARVIPRMAEQLQADLVVMGTIGRTGISGLFMGNTAETILQQLQCSVLTVKPADFVSPVKV